MYDGRKPRYRVVCKHWVYETIQNRLGENRLGKILLQGYIDETESVICNYINRGYVPEPLKFVFVNMTMDLLKSQALNGMIQNEVLSDLGVGALTSIKDGDSELKIASGKTNTGAHTADVESLLYNYKIQLDKYRILRW